MRIAQVAPLYESVPPKFYGGTERVVSILTEELIHQGHDVTLFASGDSKTKARLVAACACGLRNDPQVRESLAHHYVQLDQVFAEADDFDIIHFHSGYLHFPFAQRMTTARLTTLHGRLDIPDLRPLYRRFRELPLASISNDQRRPLAWANWQATVYHGLPKTLHYCGSGEGNYLAFLGRVSPEKRLDRAIEIATRAGMKLRVAAKIDNADREYFHEKIEHLLDHPLVEWLGEINDGDKQDFLGNARALLFPIDWPEPFGLVLIEAMACGTPVIAFRCGSVPELIEDGVNGFTVDDIDEAVGTLEKISQFDRQQCRQVFEQRFSAERMTRDYVSLYERIIKANQANNLRSNTNGIAYWSDGASFNEVPES
jgi:glycosyltransferase involved in cell wall biosynthesis